MLVILAFVLMIGDVVLLGMLTYKILKFGELEDDHMNPTDFAKDMNFIFPYELGLQAVLTVTQIYFLISFYGTPLLIAFLLNGAYLGYQAKLYSENKWRIDPAKVWNPSFKKKSQMAILIGVSIYGVCFFLYLFNLIKTLTTPHHLRK
mmetsp:Transcript_2885/g.7106  ORF Transcript_2885/g.7106 Transcript_2885/m.7106 type:complete len:148 (+) Transcript_2885:185-628(+)